MGAMRTKIKHVILLVVLVMTGAGVVVSIVGSNDKEQARLLAARLHNIINRDGENNDDQVRLNLASVDAYIKNHSNYRSTKASFEPLTDGDVVIYCEQGKLFVC